METNPFQASSSEDRPNYGGRERTLDDDLPSTQLESQSDLPADRVTRPRTRAVSTLELLEARLLNRNLEVYPITTLQFK